MQVWRSGAHSFIHSDEEASTPFLPVWGVLDYLGTHRATVEALGPCMAAEEYRDKKNGGFCIHEGHLHCRHPLSIIGRGHPLASGSTLQMLVTPAPDNTTVRDSELVVDGGRERGRERASRLRLSFKSLLGRASAGLDILVL